MTTTSDAGTKAKGRDVRRRIAEDAERHYDEKISAFFEEALSSEKSTWATCGNCKHRVEVAVPDWAARTRALETLLNQGFGRPSQEADERNVTLVIERVWPSPRDLSESAESGVADA